MEEGAAMPSRKFIMYITRALASPKFKERNYIKEVTCCMGLQ